MTTTTTTLIKPTPLLALRVEATCDAELIKEALHDYLVRWTKEGSVIGLQVHTLTPQTLRWLLSELPDCHVAAQTLEAAEHFTGERVQFEPAHIRPTGRQLRIAEACLDRAAATA